MFMPSEKKRVNLTVDSKTYEALEWMSQCEEKSLSSLSIELIKEALELSEDYYFSTVSDKRLSKKSRKIPHNKAWK